MENLTITDSNVLAFYKENPHLDINHMNHIFIDILKQLSTNLSSKIDNAMTSQILTIVSDLKGELYKLNADISTKLLQLNDAKKDYINDIRLMFSHSELSTHEKINHILEKSNDALLTKTTLLMNDIIPKSNDKNYASIESCFKQFFQTIAEDTKALLKMNGGDKSDEIIENLDTQIQKMFSNIQTSLFNAIQSSESRTFGNIQQIHENMIVQKQVQENLSIELSAFLNKYKSNSSVKGNVSECELFSLLQKIVPQDFLVNCSSEACSCDIRLTRKDKRLSNILFENKDYTSSVTTDQVEKFERDLKIQQCHGIFVSQNSPIVYKENFHIDIIGNLIHLYIPNAGYDVEKIKLAINVVDSLAEKLNLSQSDASTDGGFQISMTQFENLKNEYCEFANKKSEMFDLIRSITKQLTDKLDSIEVPVLKKMTVGDTETKHLGTVCSLCNIFNAKNKASLGAHMKSCKLLNGDKKDTAPPNAVLFVPTKRK
jgi:conjugal transfer/entry exclusion protein